MYVVCWSHPRSLTITILILLKLLPLVSNLTHNSSVPILEVHNEVLALKQDTHRSNRKGVSNRFNDIYKQLASSLKKCVDIAREKGASS